MANANSTEEPASSDSTSSSANPPVSPDDSSPTLQQPAADLQSNHVAELAESAGPPQTTPGSDPPQEVEEEEVSREVSDGLENALMERRSAAEEEEGNEDGQSQENPSGESSHRQSLTPTSSSTPSLAISSLTSHSHPLKNRWTLWFLGGNKNMDWLDRLKEVCPITTVEEFWAMYDSIRPPSTLFGCDYNLFLNNIKPIWEVPENKHGGRLVVVVDKVRQHELLDPLWLELLIALIGNQFGEETSQICGAVCNIRQKGSKICLWCKDNRNDEANRKIGVIMKTKFAAIVGNRMNLRVCFEDHSDVQTKSSSSISARLII